MTKIGLNDLSTELANMICNKFNLEKSVHILEENTVSVPIGINFNKKLDELIVFKNSILLANAEYSIDDAGQNITPTEYKAWEASKRYPVEFNFVVLKAVIPGVSASLWRGEYTLTKEAKAVPITVSGFNKDVDELLISKNGVIVAHDEYEIVDNTVKAANGGVWEATKRSPVIFEFIVFKFATPSNSIALNGNHLLDNSVGLDALHPDLKNILASISIYMKRTDFLLDAITKYGNYELKKYVTDNLDDDKSDVMDRIEASNKAYDELLNQYAKVDILSKTRHDEVLYKLERLGLIRDLESELDD